jgi:hypothetical protein
MMLSNRGLDSDAREAGARQAGRLGTQGQAG